MSHSISSYEIDSKSQIEASLRIKKFQLIRSLLIQRELASKKISSLFRTFHNKIQFMRNFFTYHIIRQREAQVTLIQSTVRRFLLQKDIKAIGLNRGIYIFFYIPPKMYYTESQCIPKISFQLKNGKRFDLNYSKALHTYYIPLKKTGKREYHLNFIVNDHNIVDSRFPVELNQKNGSFYNIISSSMMYKPRSSKIENQPNSKKWEQIFQIKKYYQKRKISIDTAVSQNTDVSAELSAILHNNITVDAPIMSSRIEGKRTKKSILRKFKGNNICKKRVTFCTRCEYVIY